MDEINLYVGYPSYVNKNMQPQKNSRSNYPIKQISMCN